MKDKKHTNENLDLAKKQFRKNSKSNSLVLLATFDKV